VLTRGDEALVQSIFYPFEMMSKRRNGVSLKVVADGPSYDSASNGRVGYIDSSAILDGNRLSVFLTNRSIDESADVMINVADSAIRSCENAEILTGPKAKATNSFAKPDVIKPKLFKGIRGKDGKAGVRLPPLSFVAMTLNLK